MNDDTDTDDMHYLDSFLQERLPALGLEYETYGPYVRGLVGDDDDNADDEHNNNNNSNHDNDDNHHDDTMDPDSDWNDVLELLQASSETHADDPNAFLVVLKRQLHERRAQHRADVQRRAQAQRIERHAHEQAMLARDIELAKLRKNDEDELMMKQQSSKGSAVMDDAKRLIVARFEYDESELYGEDGTLVKLSSADADGEQVLTNKDAAAMAHQEKLNQMKSQKTTSKKDEQLKTKQAKLDKVKQKEERRNKAQKGERHR